MRNQVQSKYRSLVNLLKTIWSAWQSLSVRQKLILLTMFIAIIAVIIPPIITQTSIATSPLKNAANQLAVKENLQQQENIALQDLHVALQDRVQTSGSISQSECNTMVKEKIADIDRKLPDSTWEILHVLNTKRINLICVDENVLPAAGAMFQPLDVAKGKGVIALKKSTTFDKLNHEFLHAFFYSLHTTDKCRSTTGEQAIYPVFEKNSVSRVKLAIANGYKKIKEFQKLYELNQHKRLTEYQSRIFNKHLSAIKDCPAVRFTVVHPKHLYEKFLAQLSEKNINNRMVKLNSGIEALLVSVTPLKEQVIIELETDPIQTIFLLPQKFSGYFQENPDAQNVIPDDKVAVAEEHALVYEVITKNAKQHFFSELEAILRKDFDYCYQQPSFKKS